MIKKAPSGREVRDVRNGYLGMNPRCVISKLCEFGQVNPSFSVYILNFNREIVIFILQGDCEQ